MQDWVAMCEAGYQALIARVAEDDGDESDSMRSELSSTDGGDTEQHQLQEEEEEEEEGAEKIPLVSTSPTAQQPSLLQEEKAGGARVISDAKPSRPDQVSNGSANVNDSPSRGPAPIVVGESMLLATVPKLVGAGVKSTTVARSSLEQQKKNVASPLRHASPVFPQAAVTPGAVVGNAALSPLNDKDSSYVRFQRCRRASGSQPSPQREEREVENSVHKENRDPGASLGGDGLPSVGRAGPEKEDVELAHGGGASPRPEVPGAGQVMVDSPAIPPPFMPAAGLRYQRSSHPRSPEKSCSAVASRLLLANRGRETGGGEVQFRYSGTLPETCDVLGFDSPPHSPTVASANGLIGTPPTLKASRVETRGDGGMAVVLGVLHANAGEEGSPSAFDGASGGGHGGERCEDGLGRMAADGSPPQASPTCGRTDCERQNRNWHSESPGSLTKQTDGEQSPQLPLPAPTPRTRTGGDGETSGGEEVTCLGEKSETRNDGGRVGGSNVGRAVLGKVSGGEGGNTGLERTASVCMSGSRNHAAESDTSQGEHGDVSDAESPPLFVGADGRNGAQRMPSRDVANSPVQTASPGGVGGCVRADGTGDGDGGEVDDEDDEETCDEAELEDCSVAELASSRPSNAANSVGGSDDLSLQHNGNHARPAGKPDVEEVGVSREKADATHLRSVGREHSGGGENALAGDEDSDANVRDCETPLQGRAVAEGDALSSGPAVDFVDTRPADGGNAEPAAMGERGSENIFSDVVDGAVAPPRSEQPREMRERSQTSETLTQSVTLYDESCSDRQGDGLHRHSRDGCDEDLRVPETLARTVGVPEGTEEGSAVALLGVGDDTNREVVMSAPPAQSFLMSDAPARDMSLPSHGLLDSANSESQVPETPVADAVVRLHFEERNEALASSQHEGKSSEGGLDTELRSLVVTATQEPINGGERASANHGRGGIRRQPVPSDTQQKLRGGESGLGWDPSECGRPVGDTSGQNDETVDGQDVLETVPPDGVGAEAERCGEVREVVCLATQETSQQDEAQDPDADEEMQEKDDQGRESRQVPETAVQSLATQEVPETAEAYRSNSFAGLDDAHETAQGERVAATAISSTCAQLEVLETPQLRGTPTQSTVDETIGTCDEEGCMLKDAGSTSTAPSNRQSELFGTQARGKGGCAESSLGMVSPKKSRSTPASPLGTACSERGNLEGSAPTGKSPSSGSRKRLMDSILSPEAWSSEPGSAGKRLRVTPTKKQPLGEGMSPTEGTELGPPIILRGGSGSEESLGECEPEVSHDLEAAQDAWQTEERYDVGGDDCFDDDEDVCHDENMVDDIVGDGDGDEVCVVLGQIKGGKSRPGQRGRVVNPYTPRAHLELRPDEDPAPDAAETRVSKAPQGKSRNAQQIAAGKATAVGQSSRPSDARQGLRRPSTKTMSFGAPSGNDIARGPSGLDNRSVDARMREKNLRASSNKILAAGRGGDWGVASFGGSFSHSPGPDTEVLCTPKCAYKLGSVT